MKRGGPLPLSAIARQARELAGRVDVPEPGEVRSYTCSSCGIEPVGARPGICAGCSTTEAEQRRAAELCDRALIPTRFRWARLGLSPFHPPGRPDIVARPEDVRRVREFRGELLVLRGPSGELKTALACARLRVEAERDGRAVYVFCDDLSPDAPKQARAISLLERAEAERAVCLDDVGQDLGGAPAGGGLAGWRGARVKRLLRALHHEHGAGRDRLLIITSGLLDGQLAESYGDDVSRRILERGPGNLALTVGGWKQVGGEWKR